MLALLALRAPNLVATDVIVDTLWAEGEDRVPERPVPDARGDAEPLTSESRAGDPAPLE